MPAATGLKRLSFATAAVLAGGVVGLVALSSFIPPDTVRRTVIAEIRSVTGLEPVVRGEVSVSLFPTATVSFTDVVLGDDSKGKAALTAERLTAKLSLLPLLLGRIETADMALTRPHITINLEPDGRSNWSTLTAALVRTLKGGKPSDQMLSLSEIRMTEGTISIADPAHGVDETLSGVEVSLAWPSIARSFAATGRFVWHNEPFDVSASASDLLATLTGDRSGLKVRLAGAPFKLAFDGHMSYLPTPRFEGTLSADGPSLREALRWAGRQPLPGGGFGLFAIKAQTVLTGGVFELNQVNIELDGNSAEGVLVFSNDPQPSVKGTLAADTLDLSPYLSTIEVMRGSDRDWSRRPIALDGFSGLDLDLRLSAARITLANVKLGRTGIAANLRDSRLTLSIVEAQAFGGVLKGSLLLAKSQTGADIKSMLQFSDVDLETCLGELFGIRRLEGKGDFSTALEATGDSVYALTHTLSGTISLSARQGALAGYNVEQLLRRLEQRPLSIGGDFRRGRTPYDKLTVTLKITQGVASVDNVALEGGPVRLALAGIASIPARELDLKGTASLISTTDSTTSFELPFVVTGQWDDPIVLPDARSLIRRSGTAAPLLDVVRDRKTRDDVREAIERLTRDGAVNPPAAAAAPPAAPAAAPAAGPPATQTSSPQ